jgi:group II intron reverse transcriptase/maturase
LPERAKQKPYAISKNVVLEAFKKVKANRGTYGIDEQTIEGFEENLKDNLYKLWNRMSSGTYFPKPVKAVPIPKKSGGTRLLGVPTVEDRIAQMVVRMYFEPEVEPIFYEDSYGYRPNKSAIDAVGITRKRCWERDWVLEYDIKGLFDNIRHDYLVKMVEEHAKQKWVVLYIERWLKAPFQMEDGTIQPRETGTPQGGVISPVLANLYLHYVLDGYMSKEFESIPWARYADDGVAHCVSKKQAEYLRDRLEKRLLEWGLELNLEKTKIVYCKDSNRKGKYGNITFDFLGYTFRPRQAKSKQGDVFTNFLPAISNEAKKRIRREIRSWTLQRKTNWEIEDIAKKYNSKVRGWINYYSHFYESETTKTMRYLNDCLIKWVRRKYKKRDSWRKAKNWLWSVRNRNPHLFAHWKLKDGSGLMAGAV